MDFKKYPLLTATVGLLGLICAGGVGLTVWQGLEYSKNKKTLDRADSQLGALLRSEVAPSEANVALAEKALAEAKAREAAIFRDLQGKEGLYVEFNEGAAPLQAILRGTAQELLTTLDAAKVKVSSRDFGFGFSRYVQKNELITAEFSDIASQNNIIKELVRLLVSVKEEKAFLALQEIRREPVELAQLQQGARPTTRGAQVGPDEYRLFPGDSLRKDGMLKTLFFQVKFTAHTDLLRRFVNAVNDSGYPFVIRGVAVAPASPDVLGSPDSPGFGGFPGFVSAPGAGAPPPGFEILSADNPAPAPNEISAPATQVVVKDDPSEFTISLEYLIPLKPAPAAPTESGK